MDAHRRPKQITNPSRLLRPASYPFMNSRPRNPVSRGIVPAWHGLTSTEAAERVATLVLAAVLFAAFAVQAGTPQQARVPARRGTVQLEAQQQRKQGSTFYADGDVDIRYGTMRLRADHAQYNAETGEARVKGNVRFDNDSQSLEAGDGEYNMRTGQGSFRNVHGAVKAVRLSNRNVLVSQNPFLFSAREIRRVNEQTYEIYSAWVTVCPVDKPVWKFYTSRASIRIDKSAKLRRANFRLLGVPILYLPYASVPVGRRLRQSGFMVPEIGQSTLKGFVIGDAFYWAPVSWFDSTTNVEVFSRRGPALVADLRAKPADDFSAAYHFFGVDDRGLPGANGVRMPQGGHESHFTLDAELPKGWRAVADVNTLSTLTFRLAFSPTYAEAVNGEVASTAFLTNNFQGFSLSFAGNGYKNYFGTPPPTTDNTLPQPSVVLRTAPEARFSSVDQAPWKWPVYLGIDAYADGVNRKDPNLTTPALVQRTAIAPRVTVPLRWGPWLGVTSTFAARVTRYGAQQSGGAVVVDSLVQKTAELTVDLRPPSLDRIYGGGDSRWKHVIEPEVTYRYVTGINNFAGILRFDENDTLTDTNEVEYSITQRLFHGTSNGSEEVFSWRVAQKYYSDPTFGGALVPGQRNVFQAVDSLSTFAFADGARRFSPVTSELRWTPRGPYEVQLLQDYDTLKNQLLANGALIKLKPYRESFVTMSYFLTHGDSVLQPRSNQIRFQAGFGEVNRPGFNVNTGMSYDFLNHFAQNQTVLASYNGSCCGIAFEYRRLALGTVRIENQFRVALLIANIGTFGNVRRQEKFY